MFCFHKYGEIKDGYQYCLKCNKAIRVEGYEKCVHEYGKWEMSFLKFNQSRVCKKCGWTEEVNFLDDRWSK
jgi:hypothetical protein